MHNNGEQVFTSRIFPRTDSKEINFFAEEGNVLVQATKWDYE
ncbi:GH32 C-terminal domain-containing protein [Bacillus sp. BP-3]|nr:GH32 C-terminal domain-containing protein [Bacillus sp. BP-3]MDC2863730.1 GH32 C-terminal domain-containing protein [Bacillus sp. BP-3]